MAYSGGSAFQPGASFADAPACSREPLLAREGIGYVPLTELPVLVPGNNGRLDIAVAVQHVSQHMLQAREGRFARDVIIAANLFLRDQRERPAHCFGRVMERGLQRYFRIVKPL